jgi:hypothetical protein
MIPLNLRFLRHSLTKITFVRFFRIFSCEIKAYAFVIALVRLGKVFPKNVVRS